MFPHNLKRAVARTRLPLVGHRRGFQKLTVSNPFGVFMLDLSKAALKGIALFYGGALVLGGAAYFFGGAYLDKYQHISSELPLTAKFNGLIAVYHQDITEKNPQAIQALIISLRSIAQEEGIDMSDLPDGKFRLLNSEQLRKKSKEWQGTYIDLVIRLSLLKAESGDVENATKLNQYSINVPMDIGTRDLRSQSLRLAAKLASRAGEMDKAEKYLLDALRFNEIYHSDIIFKEHGSVLLDSRSKINTETFQNLTDLGVIYTKNGNYTLSLEIFLNLLQVAEAQGVPSHGVIQPQQETNVLFLGPSDKALLKNYIGEILYQKGLLQKSIQWCKEAFKESYLYSRTDVRSAFVAKQSLENLIKLYERTGDSDLQTQAKEELGRIDTNVLKVSSWDFLTDIFS